MTVSKATPRMLSIFALVSVENGEKISSPECSQHRLSADNHFSFVLAISFFIFEIENFHFHAI